MSTENQISREARIAEAIRLAEERGYYPARFQRAIEWDQVLAWAERVQQADFCWKPAAECDGDHIVIGAGHEGRIAIYAGQHRILGGLLGRNPVPEYALSRIGGLDTTRPWGTPAPQVSLEDLLGG